MERLRESVWSQLGLGKESAKVWVNLWVVEEVLQQRGWWETGTSQIILEGLGG